MKQLSAAFTVVVVLLLTAVSLMAGPASFDVVDIQQPDGSVISTRLHGDEFQGWTELVHTGHTILRNSETGFWEYADRL